jgi:sirohydrochlorin cobaltochelatase
MVKVGVMVCGHGSRDVEAISEFTSVAAGIEARLPQYPVASGFLEFARPIIREGLENLYAQGVRHILAVPGMLFAAGHVKNDIPSVLNTYAAERPGVRVDYGRDLAVERRLLAVSAQRIEQAEAASTRRVPRDETLLLVVGRGTSDPDANSNISKVARMLWEGMGFGWVEVCYSGVTFPLVGPGLDHAVKLGYRRIIVFPYFLFTGVLVKRIYRITEQMSERHPQIEFLKAQYLRDHPLVLDAFTDRVQEVLDGENKMNCALCKYRSQILGFEAEVGLAQQSHHHHVEGIGAGSEHAHDVGYQADGHVHDNDHPHHHHHHQHRAYPHAGHRHGPGNRSPDNLE